MEKEIHFPGSDADNYVMLIILCANNFLICAIKTIKYCNTCISEKTINMQLYFTSIPIETQYTLSNTILKSKFIQKHINKTKPEQDTRT